jgi:hypothetical protein
MSWREELNVGQLVLGGGSRPVRPIDGTSLDNVYEDINFSITTLKKTGITEVTNAGPSGNMVAAQVGNGGGSFQANAQMSHTWVPGTALHPHIHLYVNDNAAVTVLVTTDYSIADIGGVFPTSTQVTRSLVIPANSQWKHIMFNVSASGIPMAGFTGPSTVVQVSHAIGAASVGDEQDIFIIGYDWHYRWGGSPVPYSPE